MHENALPPPVLHENTPPAEKIGFSDTNCKYSLVNPNFGHFSNVLVKFSASIIGCKKIVFLVHIW